MRPTLLPTELPREHERLERQNELQWLFNMDAPRKPRRSREGQVRLELTQQAKDVFGTLPKDE